MASLPPIPSGVILPLILLGVLGGELRLSAQGCEVTPQTGAMSVANPADGSIPETVQVRVFQSGAKSVELLRQSNIVQLGATVGPAPPAPYPDCGWPRALASLGCETPPGSCLDRG